MPVLMGVGFKPEREVLSSEITPDRVHALFFSLLSENLARELHKPSRLKPFCIWFRPFFGEERTVDKIVVEISFLREDLFPCFLSTFMLKESGELRIGDVRLRKLKRPYISEEKIISYRRIYEEASEDKTIVMDFLTPTTFRKGKSDYPLPDPSLVFKSLIRKWVTFGDVRIDKNLRKVLERDIQVSGAWIRTKKVELSRLGKVVGFTGRVVFFVDSEDREVLRWINALAKFGEFAGVGRKTTMGFGKVKVIKPSPEENPEVDREDVKEEGISE